MKETNIPATMKAILVLFLLPLQLFSQDLSGIWVGTIATSETQMPFELAINQDMTGYSMITFQYKGAEKVAVKKINLIRKDSTFTISDDKVIYNNFETRSRSIKTFCEFSVKMVDTTMVLSGAFHTRTRDLRKGDEDLATGTITLQKQNRQAQTRLIGKLDTLKLSNTLVFSSPTVAIKENPIVAVAEKGPSSVVESGDPAVARKEAPVEPAKEASAVPEKETPPAAGTGASVEAANPVKDLTAVKVRQRATNNTIATPAAIPTVPKIIAPAAEISSRKTEVIRTIDFKSDSLTLVLYDNGIVDGDTVSVVLNGEVIIPKQRLEEQAYRKVIKIPPGSGDSLQLVIYAENLGTIPPNSGLLIIEDGSDRYEVGFEGDLKKSSAVRLRRKQ
ncbi:MAG TPA: hypothetical protein VHE34_19495 [Puia sp.]|uniref:hypothetical protein n=1 Tax=Puia sp. TaxID=2045100 RepID=UPI002C0F95A2|nr:hypothetical protein [Puia sp.]HVU97425.1 hypothetical protein [Puia sp.]